MSLSPPTPPDFLGPLLEDLSDNYRQMIAEQISKFLRNSKRNSATGIDLVSYPMIQKIHHARPVLLPYLFSNLLYYGVFPDQ